MGMLMAETVTPANQVRLALADARPRIVAAVHAWRNREVAVTRDDVEQLAAGFLAVMDAAAAGDLTPRDEYLATVIPGVRAAGIPFAMTLEAMTRVVVAVVSCMPAEHHPWLADFCGDYTARLVAAWRGDGST
jgi:hypothetical protein